MYLQFIKSVLSNVNTKSFNTTILGKVENLPIYLIHPKKIDKRNKSILIVGGFHGTEPAGPYGILQYLKSSKPEEIDLNISFIPVVNVDGFDKGTRYNRFGDQSNWGFLEIPPKTSHEGTILKENFNLLKTLAHDGFLSLHENVEYSKFYLYLLSKITPQDVANILLITATKFFKLLPNKKYHTKFEGDYETKGGIVFNQFDGSFDHYMFKSGIPVCIVTETPIKNTPLAKRVVANEMFITEFIRYFENKKSKIIRSVLKEVYNKGRT